MVREHPLEGIKVQLKDMWVLVDILSIIPIHEFIVQNRQVEKNDRCHRQKSQYPMKFDGPIRGVNLGFRI
jgi:uncharacterized membrane protein